MRRCRHEFARAGRAGNATKPSGMTPHTKNMTPDAEMVTTPLTIYVGATFSRYEEARQVMDALTDAGHTIAHDWTRTRAFADDGHPLPGTAGGYDLDPEDAARHAVDDVEAVRRSDLLLMLGQAPSCGWPIETGIGIALGKTVWVVEPFKYTVFWDLPNVETFDDITESLRRLGVRAAA